MSSVTNMEGMFNDASYFNQPLREWDVSSVTTMEGMFIIQSKPEWVECVIIDQYEEHVQWGHFYCTSSFSISS